jgi:hypothetical protein
MSQRAFYSIDDDILDGFNRLVPPARRSKLVQSLMAKYVAQNDSLIEKAARQIEADPNYSDVSRDATDAGLATLHRMGNDESR